MLDGMLIQATMRKVEMELNRHIVSGSASSLALVEIAKTGDKGVFRSSVRAVFQSPGDGRKKVSFTCPAKELVEFLQVLEQCVVGTSAKLSLARSRGLLEVSILDAGVSMVRYEIHPSRTRVGTSGVVHGKYRKEPIKKSSA